MMERNLSCAQAEALESSDETTSVAGIPSAHSAKGCNVRCPKPTNITTTPNLKALEVSPIPNRSRSSPPSGRWVLMAVLATLISAYGVVFLFGNPPGDPSVKNRIMSTWWGISHVVGGALSVGIGPLQFLQSFQQRRPAIHRWVGRIYVIAVTISSICGFSVSMYAKCYTVGRYGFAVLGLLWLATIGMGMLMIWRGYIAEHREWMMRNFALTYSAVMLRWQFGLFIFLGNTSEMALTMVAFSSWIPNLIFVEWRIRQSTKLVL